LSGCPARGGLLAKGAGSAIPMAFARSCLHEGIFLKK
jgi:hypothetical protein